MRGLQKLKLSLEYNWDSYVFDPPSLFDGEAILGRALLKIIKEELGHIEEITMENDDPDDDILLWMAFELTKRNEAWVQPLPAHIGLGKTSTCSALPSLEKEIVKARAAWDDDDFIPSDKVNRVDRLIQGFGVFTQGLASEARRTSIKAMIGDGC